MVRSESETAYIGLGSNLGDRRTNLEQAVNLMDTTGHIRVLKTSTYFETAPLGPPQPYFLNAVVEITTNLSPEALLETIKKIELYMGRIPSGKWGPRLIDIDILLYGERIIDADSLKVPHPEMVRRCFVLEPLAQIAPEVRHPLLDRTAAELLGCLSGGAEA